LKWGEATATGERQNGNHPDKLYRITVDLYDRLAESGILDVIITTTAGPEQLSTGRFSSSIRSNVLVRSANLSFRPFPVGRGEGQVTRQR